MRNMFCNS
jgi:hypothetical protein